MEKHTPEALVGNVVQLISLPSVYTRLEEVLKIPKHTRNDVANVVSIDPALCARILRIINSSYYALPNSVESIAVAVNLIGEYDLRNMVLVTSAVNSVAALIDAGIDMTVFWRHSIRCGITAKLLAKFKPEIEPELLFLVGLLHDLGQLIIYKGEPELSATVTWHVRNEDKQRYQVEQIFLGFDHAIVGGLLMDSWGLSAKLREIIKYHHRPEQATQYCQETKLIYLADQLAHFLELHAHLVDIDIEDLPVPTLVYLEDLNVSKKQLLLLLNDVMEQSRVIEEIICKA